MLMPSCLDFGVVKVVSTIEGKYFAMACLCFSRSLRQNGPIPVLLPAGVDGVAAVIVTATK